MTEGWFRVEESLYYFHLWKIVSIWHYFFFFVFFFQPRTTHKKKNNHKKPHNLGQWMPDKCRETSMWYRYLEKEDDIPDKSKHNGRIAISDVCRIDADQLHLQRINDSSHTIVPTGCFQNALLLPFWLNTYVSFLQES